MSTQLEELTHKVLKFRNDRDWEQFHDPRNLAMSLSIEAAELLELHLWQPVDPKNRSTPKEEQIEKIGDELADVFYNVLLLANAYQVNLEEILEKKLIKNDAKYPVSKSKGNSQKWDKLQNE